MWYIQDGHLYISQTDTKIDLSLAAEGNQQYILRALNAYDKLVPFLRQLNDIKAMELMNDLGIDEAQN